MKRYILIDIPCVLLVLISSLLLIYSVDGYYRFASLEKNREALKPTTPPDALIKYIGNLDANDEHLAIAAKTLKNNHTEIMMMHDFEVQVFKSLKSRFQLLIFVSGLFVLLTLYLSNGFVRHFKKSSNHSLKGTK